MNEACFKFLCPVGLTDTAIKAHSNDFSVYIVPAAFWGNVVLSYTNVVYGHHIWLSTLNEAYFKFLCPVGFTDTAFKAHSNEFSVNIDPAAFWGNVVLSYTNVVSINCIWLRYIE